MLKEIPNAVLYQRHDLFEQVLKVGICTSRIFFQRYPGVILLNSDLNLLQHFDGISDAFLRSIYVSKRLSIDIL